LSGKAGSGVVEKRRADCSMMNSSCLRKVAELKRDLTEKSIEASLFFFAAA
jgi:hypothetical protein